MEEILRLLKNSGLRDWGICSFDRVSGCLLECRAKNRLPQNTQSIFVSVLPYFTQCGPHNVSRYAVCPDYHRVAETYFSRACELLQKSFPEESFVWFADNSPIPEVRAAAAAGLGRVGENGLLITPQYGSWVFIGEIVSSLPAPVWGEEIKPCIQCGKCRKSCPGGALDNGRVIVEQCASHISQKKGELSQPQRNLVLKSGLAWGCDICQEVCPMNRCAEETYLPELRQDLFPLLAPGQSLDLENRAFHWRGPKVIERNLSFFKTKSNN